MLNYNMLLYFSSRVSICDMENHCDSDLWISVPACSHMCHHQNDSGDFGESTESSGHLQSCFRLIILLFFLWLPGVCRDETLGERTEGD